MEDLPAAVQYEVISFSPQAQGSVCHTAYAIQLKFCQQERTNAIHTGGSAGLYQQLRQAVTH